MLQIANIKIDNRMPFTLIAGPCIIEDKNSLIYEAEKLKQITQKLGIPFIFKVSYDKANRSSIHSYRGPGLREGKKIIAELKAQVDIPVLVDVHLPSEATEIAEVADIIQIPAFLCRQTDLILAAAQTGKIVNVKKGQFLSPEEVFGIIEKVRSTGNDKVMITERGTTFGYNNLVVDMRSLEIMKKFDVPIVFDATHSVQRPGYRDEHGQLKTAGNREFVPVLARAAISVGIAGLYMEVHPAPATALSDAANQWPLNEIELLLKFLKKIDNIIKEEADLI